MLFGRKSVHRKTGNAEAAGNVVFAQHRIRSQPQPQAFGQNLRLLYAGFWHQDDEFVAAVTCNHVRLAALLFQQPSHTRQYEIAFEVAQSCRSLP